MTQQSKFASDFEANAIADLEAFRRVKRMVQEGRLAANSFLAFAPPKTNQIQNGSHPVLETTAALSPRSREVESDVSAAVESFAGQFTISDVLKKLRADGKDYKDSSVRSAVVRMVPEVIDVVVQGKGRRATIFTPLMGINPPKRHAAQ
jgi:hypothetical protein